MIYLKTPNEITEIEKVNKMGAEVLQMCYEHIQAGISTIELEKIAEKYCVDNDVLPAFKGYKGFPFCLCVSVNEEVVHGFPSERILKNGDIISVDFGLNRNGYFSDAAFTKAVGKIPANIKKLIKTSEESLYLGIDQAEAGNRIYDIGAAIQNHAIFNNFDVIRDYVGHGVGLSQHEWPKVPNYVSTGINWKLKLGMVIAIEPMLVEGSYDTFVRENGWTVVSKDGKMSAHFEHSVAITKDGPRILSKL